MTLAVQENVTICGCALGWRPVNEKTTVPGMIW